MRAARQGAPPGHRSRLHQDRTRKCCSTPPTTSRAKPRPSAIRRSPRAADSLCRLIEYTPDATRIPAQLVDQHVDAVRAIYREYSRSDAKDLAAVLTRALARGDRRIPDPREPQPPGCARTDHRRAVDRAGIAFAIPKACADSVSARSSRHSGFDGGATPPSARLRSAPDNARRDKRTVIGHQIVAEHARFLARGLDREAPQQRQQRSHVVAALGRAGLQARARPCGA